MWKGLVLLARQDMSHAKATPSNRLPLGEQVSDQADGVRKQLFLHQESDEFLRRKLVGQESLGFIAHLGTGAKLPQRRFRCFRYLITAHVFRLSKDSNPR